MVQIVIEDQIRGEQVAVDMLDHDTVRAAITRLVDDFGLPKQSFKKQLLTYHLARADGDGSGRPFDIDDPVATLDLTDSERLVLSSPDASPVWAEITQLIGDVENELEVQATTLVDTVTTEIRTDVSERLTAIRQEIEKEARGRLRGFGSGLPFLRRFRARRLMSRLARTGATPNAVADVRVGLSQLTTAVSHVWRITPFVVGATVAAGAATAVEIADDDVNAKDIVNELTTAEPGEKSPLELAVDSAINGDNGTGDTQGEGVEGDDGLLLTKGDVDDAVAGAIRVALQEADVNDLPELFVTDLAKEIGEQLTERIQAEVPTAERDSIATAALGGVTRSSPTRDLEPNQTLWDLASDMQGNPDPTCGDGPFEEPLTVYVRRIWAANVGTLGFDPNSVDPADDLKVPCPI